MKSGSFLLALPAVMAAAALVACDGKQGDLGPVGPVGPTGSVGPTGAVGPTGTAGPTGAEGPTGAQGPTGPQGNPGTPGTPGTPGAPGTSVGGIAGTITAAVGGAPVSGATLTAMPGDFTATSLTTGAYAFVDLPIGVYMLTVNATGFAQNTAAHVSVTAGRVTTQSFTMAVPAPTTGTVTGVVTVDTVASSTLLAEGATVALVKASDVAASTSEAPMEPLAAASTLKATTGADGRYTLTNVPPGSYFIHVTPAAANATTQLPGGSGSRVASTVVAGQSLTKDVMLSQQPSPAATYVGSSACLLCHSTHTDYKKTLHANVFRVPGVASQLQDLSGLPNRDKALIHFKDVTAEPLNTRDNTGSGDGLGMRITQALISTFPTGYNILLGFDGRYFAQIQNAATSVISQKYYVDFTFGGHGIYKERFVTRVDKDGNYVATAGAGTSYYILPLQYDEALQAGVEPFHPYNASNWTPPTVAGGPAGKPASTKSFDLECAGCHFTGMKLSKDANGNYLAGAANDPNGVLDYDGNGSKDEMSIGCEACHGPGSEHRTSLGNRIIRPDLLSAERASQLCGQCHTRGTGKGTMGTDKTGYPSAGADAALRFFKPGMSRAEFLADYHTDGLGVWGDDRKHARQHHQQYNDWLKSKHYKNDVHLMSCGDCHNMHNRANGPSLSERTDNNKLCMNCHSYWTFNLGGPPWAPAPYTPQQEGVAVAQHMAEKAHMASGYSPAVSLPNAVTPDGIGNCSGCHMPKTAASQSRFIHEVVTAGQPTGPRIRGDVSSHQFDVIWPAVSDVLFTSGVSNRQLSNSCGSCHNTIMGILPNYAY